MKSKQWIIPADLIDESDELAESSFLAKPNKEGYVRLYELNGWTTTYWKIVKQCENMRAYIVERRSVPEYWKNVIRPNLNP